MQHEGMIKYLKPKVLVYVCTALANSVVEVMLNISSLETEVYFQFFICAMNMTAIHTFSYGGIEMRLCTPRTL